MHENTLESRPVSESLLPLKMLLKTSFCNFKRPFIRGQMGNKVFKVLFSAPRFCLLAR